MLKRCLTERSRMDTRFRLKALSTLLTIVVFCCQQTKGQDICHCLNSSECSTYREQGCFPCEYGWSGSNCQIQNAAFSQRTEQSSTYIDCGTPCDVRTSGNAVNGAQTTSDLTKCAQTENSTSGHSWTLRLPNFALINRIRAYFPTTVGSLQGLQVLINGNLCYTATTATVPTDIPCGRTINGYNITLYLPPNGYRVLAVCEVEVFVCGNGWYGSQCDKRCTCRNIVEVCNKVTGECSSGCPDGYNGTDCKVCADGRYGNNCSSVCGNCRKNGVCHKTTGTCSTGCASGWFGPYCKTPCVDGRYGIQCSAVCGYCLNRVPCNKSTGVCPTGCSPGYEGEHCVQSCQSGRYGINCVNQCGKCRGDEDVCDKATGICFQGCEAGWKGSNCDIECESGKYGMDCVHSCGQCKNNIPCNKTTGYCAEGCQPGWRGNECKTKCPTYTYGDRCANVCGRCRSGEVCNEVSGWCPNECQAGFQPPICSQECADGKYGINCVYTCGACRNGAACDKTSGRCTNGCQPGKTGDFCTSNCPDGQYGLGCGGSCGQCRDGDLCNKTTGACPYGCKVGYNGTLCQTACPPGSYGIQCMKKCGHCLDLTQCDFATGLCPSGCQPGWTESNCNQVCTNKTYGKNCALKCGNCKVGDHCDKATGHCPNGCSAGYKWELCEQECDAGSFGEDCSQTCGHCKDNAACDHVLGVCPGFCEPGWQGPNCLTACPDGYYGTNCTSACGKCKDKAVCNNTNGRCPDEACEPGWTSPSCNAVCPDGKYGSSCLSQCGACKGGVVCNKVTGQCPGECELGWTDADCQKECPDGFYGYRCEKRCGKCAVGKPCNKTSGICDDCSPGYNGLLCNNDCRPGFFGDGCNLVCGQCDSPNNLCNPVTGECNSCRPGWKGSRCTRACDNGEYGPNCSLKCGACREGTTCAKDDGRCPSGCRPGSSGDNCTIGCPEGRYGEGCTSECGRCKDTEICDTNTGHCPSGCKSSWRGIKCDKECENGSYGENCENTCGKCSGNQPCDKISGVCPLSCVDGFTGELCQEAVPPKENDMTGMIAGIVIGVLVMAAIVIVAIFCFIRRRKGKDGYIYTEDNVLKPLDNVEKSTRVDTDYQSLSRVSMASSRNRSDINLPFETTFDVESTLGLSIPTVVSSTVSASELSGQVVGVDDDALDIQSVNSEYDWPTDDETSTAFAVYEIGEHIEMKMAAGGFENEFSMLPGGMHFPHTVGLLPDNASKNRYPRSLPYDDNRVYLVNSDPHVSDYINASHIDGFRIMEEYIACQGPLEQTVNDFWRMVWDKKVCKIVMLGRTRENGKSKCYKYWPDVKEGQTYGDLSVTCNRVISRAHQTMREFYIYDHQDAEKRLVTQFQFMSWPEGGFPSPPVLVSFIKQVAKTENSRWPTVVHCSSGIGRTGCFITINAMAEQARLEPEIDVFKYVCRMRLQRPEMVRTRLQYAGVHQALHDMLASKETLLSTGDMMERYRSTAFKSMSTNSDLGSEFQTLDEMRPVLSLSETQYARRPENIRKNRSLDILPGSQDRVILKGNAVKPGHYVNAVYLPSVLHRRGFIITQQPLTHTVEQFWTLVQEQESVTIVSLTPTDLSPLARRDYGEYMPRNNGQALSVGKYEILLKSTVNTREEIPEKTLILRTKGTGDFTPSRHIKVFSVPDWSAGEDVPSSKYVLLILLEALVKRQKDAGQHPIIVHCLNGASRSGLFCVVSNIISRLKLDREVDIFLTVRELQCIRPSIITSFTQYAFCYEVARNFIKSTERS